MHGVPRSMRLGVPVLALAIVWLAACSPLASATPATSSPGPATPVPSPATAVRDTPGASPAGDLVTLIEGLAVAPEHVGGYDRDMFPLWIDANGDGCNTRREVLIAQAVTPPHVGPGCDLTGGRWRSPYDGLEFDDPSGVEIDHVVALAEAWRSGAYAWTRERREAYANDLGVPFALVTSSTASNQAKADLAPGEWMPPLASDRCPFLVAWVAVKARWDLSIDPAERRDLLDLADGCRGVPVPAVTRP
jgi:Protein of unknown function (DUF1524)